MTARAREGRRGGFLWGRVARYQEPAIKSDNGIRMMEWEINEYGRGLRYLFPKSSVGSPMITQQKLTERSETPGLRSSRCMRSKVE